jgi:Fe-S-cluster-containing hydrogenase component 2
MHALTIEDDQIVVDQEKCLGCGLCVHKCKTHTLALKRRSNKTPEPSGLRLMAKMLQERDKLPRIFENIPRDLL